MFNFEQDQADVAALINEAGITITQEKTSTTLKAIINRRSDDMAREFAEDIGDTSAQGGALAMMSFSYLGASLEGGDYLSYGDKRAVILKIKRREYGDTLVRVRCLVEEMVA